MSRTNKKRLMIPISVISTFGLIVFFCLFFWQRDSLHANEEAGEPVQIASLEENSRMVGPFTGVALDAETKEPIAGAQIYLEIYYKCKPDYYYELFIKGLWENADGRKERISYSQTDSNGRYNMPGYMLLRPFCKYSSAKYFFVLYKEGYVCYKSNFIFMDGERKDFKVKNNTVLLEKWDDTLYSPKDHSRHIQFFGFALRCRSDIPGAQRFCIEAREEMILACMNVNPTYPTIRKLCEEQVDRKIYGERGRQP